MIRCKLGVSKQAKHRHLSWGFTAMVITSAAALPEGWAAGDSNRSPAPNERVDVGLPQVPVHAPTFKPEGESGAWDDSEGAGTSSRPHDPRSILDSANPFMSNWEDAVSEPTDDHPQDSRSATTYSDGQGDAQEDLEAAPQEASLLGGSPGDPAATLSSMSGIGHEVDAPFNGSFSQRVTIEVPAYHGLEPKLWLAYDSNAGARAGGYWAGFAGIGFRLAGLSDINRGSRVYGAPRFDETDVFSLDGDELIACGAGVDSPACTTGAAGVGITYYATRVESFLQIKRDANTNTWQVTGRDGTVSTYAAVSSWGAADATFPMLANDTRWLLASVADTHGNTVVYSYQCADAPVCWPQSIVYNGTVIMLHHEAAPQEAHLTLATGKNLVALDQRLTAIDIATGGSRVRAYNLTYEQSPATGYSLLLSAQVFGKDATIDNDHVTGGTSLPATSFAYQGAALAWGAGANINIPMTGGSSVRDINGDGKADLFDVYISDPGMVNGPNAGTCAIYHAGLSAGGGLGFPPGNKCEIGSYIANDASINNSSHQLGVLDFDGDGKVDLIHQYYHSSNSLGGKGYGFKSSYITAILKNNNGALTTESSLGGSSSPVSFINADVDGDGREDIILGSRLLRYNPAGAFPGWGPPGIPISLPVPSAFMVMDANGDGRSDIVQASNSANGQLQISYGYSTGLNFSAAQTLYFNGQLSSQVCGSSILQVPGSLKMVPPDMRAMPSDVNGDGKVDIVYLEEAAGANAHVSVLLSTGSGFVKQTWASDIPIAMLPTNTDSG